MISSALLETSVRLFHIPNSCFSTRKLLITYTATLHDVPVIMYDQIGCGRSTHLPEKNGDAGFWSMSLFLSELDNLLSHLGIQDSYSLLGQSWGGTVAAEHAILHPKGLKKLIIADSSASGK